MPNDPSWDLPGLLALLLILLVFSAAASCSGPRIDERIDAVEKDVAALHKRMENAERAADEAREFVRAVPHACPCKR
jgi:hypothetical protein